jgi:hypothetical protein
MGDVVEFPQSARVEQPELTDTQRALLILLGADADNPRWIALAGYNRNTGRSHDFWVPAIDWRGLDRIILEDGTFLPRANLSSPRR